MGIVFYSLRDAARALIRRPGLTLAIVLTLGPAFGGALTVFDLINLLSWRPPTVARPSEVVEVYTANAQGPYGLWGPTSYADYLDYRESGSSMVGLAAATGHSAELTTEHGTQRLALGAVSGNYFEVLGVKAAAGRTLAPADDLDGTAPMVMLSFGLWHRDFEASPEIVGRVIRLDD